LETLLLPVRLNQTRDASSLKSAPADQFSSWQAYVDLHMPSVLNPTSAAIWATRLPTKIKFFGWLVSKGSLNSRANLLYKNIRSRSESNCECCPGILETEDLDCLLVVSLWTRLQITWNGGDIRVPWSAKHPDSLPASVWKDVILIVLWQVWKAWNSLIFELVDRSLSNVIRLIVHEIDCWSHRYVKHRQQMWAWRDFFGSCL